MTCNVTGLRARQVDVFSQGPLTGNGLAVFQSETELDAGLMQNLTREMRQYESIFLVPEERPNTFRARIFTMEEELPFAGHPALGAGAVLHERLVQDDEGSKAWTLALGTRDVAVHTERTKEGYRAVMDQGVAGFGEPLPREMAESLCLGHGVSADLLAPDLPVQVVSTGLPYLIIPVHRGLEQVRIVAREYGRMLAEVGAAFAYVVDVRAMEGRTWDNDGRVEDIATGSAAGPVGAYMVRHGLGSSGEPMVLAQGGFMDRPSRIEVTVCEESGRGLRVRVGGRVDMVGTMCFD